jgi:hypothetical protein
MEIAPGAVASRGVAHHALVLESEALIEVPGAAVVFVDIEEEPVSIELHKCDPNQLFKDAAAEATVRYGDNNALKLNRTRVFLEPRRMAYAWSSLCAVSLT